MAARPAPDAKVWMIRWERIVEWIPLAPFIVVMLRNPLVRREEITREADAETTRLLGAGGQQVDEALRQIDSYCQMQLSRISTLEAKAVSVLQGLAIIFAVFAVIQNTAWSHLPVPVRWLFVVADIYAVAAIIQAMLAGLPKQLDFIGPDDLHDNLSCHYLQVRVAAIRHAHYCSNDVHIRRLAVSVKGALWQACIAVILSVVALVLIIPRI